MIISAHKLSTIQRCDKIYVLNNGMFEEYGTHEELMGLEKNYYDLYNNHLSKSIMSNGSEGDSSSNGLNSKI